MKYLAAAAIALLLIPTTIGMSTAVAQDGLSGMPPRTLEVAQGKEAKKAPKRVSTKTRLNQPLGLDAITVDASATNAQIKRDHGAAASKAKHRFVSTFSTFHKRNGLPQVVTFDDRALTYYSGTHRVSRLQNVQLISASTRQKLGIKSGASVVPVSLVKDGSTQLMVWRKVQNKQRDTLYKLTVYRVFGRYFGKLTDQTIAVKPAGKSRILPTRTIEWTQGKEHADLHVQLLDRAGNPAPQGKQVYKYNPWEGMYRAPEFIPTSPTKARTASNDLSNAQ